MAFISAENFKSQETAKGGRSVSKFCRMGIYESGRKNAEIHKPSLAIFISQACMIKMRWLAGDRVEVLFDEDDQSLVMVRRVTTGGYSLSSPDGTAGVGKCSACNIKFTAPDRLPFKVGDRFSEQYSKADPAGLVIKFA